MDGQIGPLGLNLLHSPDDRKGPLGLNLLHSPSEPLIDFTFVHGLGGGSRSTWSKTSSVSHSWPQEWLPKDPAFRTVRVHSFGYDSDWLKGKKDNRLTIGDVGESLLGYISTSPYIGDANTPIVLIGHSIGGLVIKKAYMLARQRPAYKALSERFRAIFFLAAPYRGSDSPKLSTIISQIAYSSRAYVADLERGAGTVDWQSILRNYAADVDLWSVYETQELKFAVFRTREEKKVPIDADHRSICKFETPTDTNYVLLRNALVSTMQSMCKPGMAQHMYDEPR